MPTVLISGGTGTIGRRLSEMLVAKNYHVIILTRKLPAHSSQEKISYATWDVATQQLDEQAFAKADYIVHLAGANVGEKRWTKKRKDEILQSRIQPAGLLIKALHQVKHNVKAFISASAIGWYGADNAHTLQNGFDEAAPAANNFLGNTCRLWEQSTTPAAQMGIRLVTLRTGIVLSNEGGAFVEFKKPLKFGIAAILGSGNQHISWIHIDDICRLYIHAIENEISGAYNAVTADVVSNKTLIVQTAKKLRRNFYIPIHVPSFLLKILLGEMSVEVLKSTTVNNSKIKSTGFQFMYPSLAAALDNLCAK